MQNRKPLGEMTCEQCGQVTIRRAVNQKYCPDCRAERQLALEARRKTFHLGHELGGEQLNRFIDALCLLQRRADLLAINQVMFVNDLGRRANQAAQSGLSLYVSPAQLSWFEALQIKVRDRITAEQDAAQMQREAQHLQQLLAQDAASGSVN